VPGLLAHVVPSHPRSATCSIYAFAAIIAIAMGSCSFAFARRSAVTAR
jgi:hypothetical protein